MVGTRRLELLTCQGCYKCPYNNLHGCGRLPSTRNDVQDHAIVGWAYGYCLSSWTESRPGLPPPPLNGEKRQMARV